MKMLIKFALVLCLFGSVALGDGNMPGGNYQCPPEGCPPPPCTENCGSAMASNDTDGAIDTTDSLVVVVDTIGEALLYVY